MAYGAALIGNGDAMWGGKLEIDFLMHRSANGRWYTLLPSRRCCDVNVIWFIFSFSITDSYMEVCNPRFLAQRLSCAATCDELGARVNRYATRRMLTEPLSQYIFFLPQSGICLHISVTCKLRTDESKNHRSECVCVCAPRIGTWPSSQRGEKQRNGQKIEQNRAVSRICNRCSSHSFLLWVIWAAIQGFLRVQHCDGKQELVTITIFGSGMCIADQAAISMPSRCRLRRVHISHRRSGCDLPILGNAIKKMYRKLLLSRCNQTLNVRILISDRSTAQMARSFVKNMCAVFWNPGLAHARLCVR